MKKIVLVLGLVTGMVANAQSTPQDSTHHHPTLKSELKDYWKRANTPGTSDYHILWGGLGFGLGYWFVDWVNSDHTKSGGGFAIYNGQCSAIAASTGQRCKRQASSGSAYCWQHH